MPETLIKVKIDPTGKVSSVGVVGSGTLAAGGPRDGGFSGGDVLSVLQSIDRKLGGPSGREPTDKKKMRFPIFDPIKNYGKSLIAGTPLWAGIEQTFQTRAGAIERTAALAGDQAAMGTPMPKEIQAQIFKQTLAQERRRALERYDLQIQYGGPVDTITGWVGKQWETNVMPHWDRWRGNIGVYAENAQSNEAFRRQQVQINGQRLENNTLGR